MKRWISGCLSLLALACLMIAPAHAHGPAITPHKGPWGYYATWDKVPLQFQKIAQPLVGGGYWVPHNTHTCYGSH